MTVTLGDQTIDSFTIEPKKEVIRKPTITAAQLGTADVVDLKISVDKSYVPAVITNGANRDPRELGVRVFHAYVQPVSCMKYLLRPHRPGHRDASVGGADLFLRTRSMSVASHRFEGDRIIVALRGGGEMTFDRALVMKSLPTKCRTSTDADSRGNEDAAVPSTGSLAAGTTAYDPIIESASRSPWRRCAAPESSHPGRIGISATRAIAQRRDGSDAADAEDRQAIQGAEPVRSREQHRGGHEISQALLNEFELPLALAAYNAGEGAVRRSAASRHTRKRRPTSEDSRLLSAA